MKASATGYRDVSFTPEGESREKRGINLYFTANSPDVVGQLADRVWIDEATSLILCDRVRAMDFSKPFPVELVYDYVPGRKRPALLDVKRI